MNIVWERFVHKHEHQATITYCAKGCTVRGRHLEQCTDTECRGCLPRRAKYGRLCGWCWQRLNADVVDAPTLVEHLREVAEPDAAAAAPSDSRSYRDPAEGSALSAAVDAADEIHAVLASWALLIVDEHPAGLTGPDQRAWRSTTPYLATDKETGERYQMYEHPVGFRDAAATGRLVRWLLPHLTWAAEQDWIGDMRRELGHLMATTRARWPMEESERPVPFATCSECDRASLVYYPPSEFRAQVQVACNHPECGHIYDERSWGLLVRLIEHERKIGAR